AGWGVAAATVDGDMPCAAASSLKPGSHGSNGGVLRQFAWPNADTGAAVNSAASTAHVDRVVCMVIVRIGLATFAGLASSRLATALLARGMATRLCSSSARLNRLIGPGYVLSARL